MPRGTRLRLSASTLGRIAEAMMTAKKRSATTSLPTDTVANTAKTPSTTRVDTATRAASRPSDMGALARRGRLRRDAVLKTDGQRVPLVV